MLPPKIEGEQGRIKAGLWSRGSVIRAYGLGRAKLKKGSYKWRPLKWSAASNVKIKSARKYDSLKKISPTPLSSSFGPENGSG